MSSGGAYENLQHMVACGPTREEFWVPVLKLLSDLRMQPPEHEELLLIFGLISAKKMMPGNLFGIIQLAWRCLYAEHTASNLEGTTYSPERAYTRLVRMIITRLRAHGRKWVRWINTGQYTQPQHVIPERHRQKHVIEVGGQDGAYPTYTIDKVIMEEAERLQLSG